MSDPAQVAQEYAIDVSLAAEPPPEPWGDNIQYADYCLILRGRIVAVVEAKRTSKEPQLGQEQGLQYAQRIQHLQGGPLPFVLYTNGHETWLWESDFYPPVKVRGFPSPSDLEWLDQRRAAREPLAAAPIAPDIAGRPYQVAAIRAVLEGVESRRRAPAVLQRQRAGAPVTWDLAGRRRAQRSGVTGRAVHLTSRGASPIVRGCCSSHRSWCRAQRAVANCTRTQCPTSPH